MKTPTKCGSSIAFLSTRLAALQHQTTSESMPHLPRDYRLASAIRDYKRAICYVARANSSLRTTKGDCGPVDERVQAQSEASAHPPGTKATQLWGSEVSRRDQAQDAAVWQRGNGLVVHGRRGGADFPPWRQLEPILASLALKVSAASTSSKMSASSHRGGSFDLSGQLMT
jgi:hypothetical protein